MTDADPCPFCGNVDPRKFTVQGDDAAQWVHCWGCGGRGPTATRVGARNRAEQQARAVARWNMRITTRRTP